MKRYTCCGNDFRKGAGRNAKGFGGCGQRVTAARKAIMTVLESHTGHLSAEDIYMKVHQIYPSIGLTTVYRNLDLLSSNGIISKFEFGDGRARYEYISEKKRGSLHHHHLICRVCGKVTEYEVSKDERDFFHGAEARLSKKYDFKIDEHRVQIFGVCSGCNES